MTDSNSQNPSNPYGDPSTSPFGGSASQQPEGQSTYGDTGQQSQQGDSAPSYGAEPYGASAQGSSAEGSSSYGSEGYGSASEAPSGYGEAAHTSDPNAYAASDASYGQQQSYGEQQGQGYGEGGYSGQADSAAAYGGQQSYGAGQVATSSGYGNYAQTTPGGDKRGMSITAMCCGIGGLLIALAFGWFSFGWLSALACIAAIIFGIIGLRREPRGKGFAITGIITGGLGLLISIVQIILWIVFLSAAASLVDTYGTYTYSTY